jgi:glycosyltransferase involved in cell wall biosynthesis
MSEAEGLRLLYSSYHCYLDPCSGAAWSARDLCALLTARGWRCQVLSGPSLSFEAGPPLQELLGNPAFAPLLGSEFAVRPCVGGPVPCSLFELTLDGVPVALFDTPTSLRPPRRSEGYFFLARFERTLAESQASLVLIHGGDWLAAEMVAAARRRGIPVVCWVQRREDTQEIVLRHASAILTTSELLRKKLLGKEAKVLPPPLDWTRLTCPEIDGKYLTFVSPAPDTGVFLIAAIVQEVHRRRPDIPFLVVEGRGKLSWLREAGLDLDRLGTVFGMSATSDPRAFLRVSRALLMPAPAVDGFPRLAAEALLNGIPVLAGRRGSVPETLEQAAILCHLPEWYTPESRLVLAPAEVEPWVEAVLRLWDEPAYYEEQRRRGQVAAAAWHPERLGPPYHVFLSGVVQASARPALPQAEAVPAAPVLLPLPAVPGRRLLCSSYHCFLDPSSGAAQSLRDLLPLLATRGWSCRVFGGSQLDFESGHTFAELAIDPSFQSQMVSLRISPPLYLGTHNGIPVTVLDAPGTRAYHAPTEEGSALYLAHFEQELERFRPDVLLTYGSYDVSRACMDLAKRRGTRVVFWLRNCAYREADLFQPVDAVLVPTRFSQEFYRSHLGIDCTPIFSPINWARVECSESEGKYVTFVNPHPQKGVFVFASIAREMARRRPDIPFLVVEGRGKVSWLGRTGIDLDQLGNVYGMAHTLDPRQFYRVSRAVLVPSLWEETFARVTAEAMVNGIPVLASNRGGLPEVLAEAGFLFDVPARYTPATRELPTAEEVAPWVKTLLRLWDDADFYAEQQRRARSAARAWHPDRLAAEYDQLLSKVVRGPDIPATSPHRIT